MAYDETLADTVRAALSGERFEEKRMMGGLVFMVNGKMCVSVATRPDHILMVRVDPNNQDVLKRKGAKQAIMRGRQMPGWIFLTEEALKTEEDFDYWIALALKFNKNFESK